MEQGKLEVVGVDSVQRLWGRVGGADAEVRVFSELQRLGFAVRGDRVWLPEERARLTVKVMEKVEVDPAFFVRVRKGEEHARVEVQREKIEIPRVVAVAGEDGSGQIAWLRYKEVEL